MILLAIGPGVASYGHGTQAFYQVAAALIPVLMGVAFFSLRAVHAIDAALDAINESSLDAVYLVRINSSDWVRWWVRLRIGLAVVALIVALAVGLGAPVYLVIAESTCAVVLYNGRATHLEGQIVGIGVAVAITCVAVTLIFWLIANLWAAYERRVLERPDPTADPDQERNAAGFEAG